MAIVTTVPDGNALDIDSLAQTFVYNGDDTLQYIEVKTSDDTYRQTYTYVGGKVQTISAWTKQ
jgi:hypothetical protein